MYDMIHPNGVNSFGCARNIINKFITKYKTAKFKNSNFYNTPLTSTHSAGLLALDLESLNTYEEVHPGLVIYDNAMYPFNTKMWTVCEQNDLLIGFNS